MRDHTAVLSVAALPRQKFSGKELYPTIFIKAAVYARNIITSHPFIDGNKRTGMAVAAVFLESNGYRVVAEEGEIEKCALYIVREKPELREIAQWFERHVNKGRRSKS